MKCTPNLVSVWRTFKRLRFSNELLSLINQLNIFMPFHFYIGDLRNIYIEAEIIRYSFFLSFSLFLSITLITKWHGPICNRSCIYYLP